MAATKDVLENKDAKGHGSNKREKGMTKSATAHDLTDSIDRQMFSSQKPTASKEAVTAAESADHKLAAEKHRSASAFHSRKGGENGPGSAGTRMKSKHKKAASAHMEAALFHEGNESKSAAYEVDHASLKRSFKEQVRDDQKAHDLATKAMERRSSKNVKESAVMTKTTTVEGRLRTRDVLEFGPSSASLRVDREKGIIYGVRILGRKSDGNHLGYPREVTQRAIPLYEGIKVNCDHPPRDHNKQVIQTDRSVFDRFGKLLNVRDEPEGLTGDLHFLTSHPMAPAVCEAAEKMPDIFGLSHNANVRESLDSGQVIAINRVRSVDLVADPGTTRGIFESSTGGNAMSMGEDMDTDTMEDDPNGATATADPLDMLMENFGQQTIDIFNDTTMDAAAKVKAFKSLVKKSDKVRELLCDDDEEAEGDDAAEGDAEEEEDEGTDTAESNTNPGNVAPNAELETLKKREQARDVLESAGIVSTDKKLREARISAIASVIGDKDQVKALTDSWATTNTGNGNKPKSKAARDVIESANDNPAGKPDASGFKPRTVEQMKAEAGMAYSRPALQGQR